MKTTDGKFLDVCKNVAKDYPEIEVDDWYIDIMTAKLIDEKRRGQFEVSDSSESLRRYPD